MTREPRFLVTGAHGCVGAWVVAELVAAGRSVVTFDLSRKARRLELIVGETARSVPHVTGDIGDLATLERALDDHAVTNVIHLAALQVPLVRRDPPAGARVNVGGTVNVFEAAARRSLAPVVYASSIAAYDPEGTFRRHPATLYGVFKRANEATAQVYFAEAGVASVGLRPHTVYGVGRDQGLTSAPTVAMLAAAAGAPFTIPYAGTSQLQLARDVARSFVAASVAGASGASVHDLPGRKASIADICAAIEAVVPDAAVDYAGEELPFPSDVDAASFEAFLPGLEQTTLADGVAETIDRFRKLLRTGAVAPPAPA